MAIAGSDMAGKVTLNTGTGTSGGNALIFTVAYAVTYTSLTYAVLYPANPAAALLSGVTMPYVCGGTTANFQVCAGSTALAASTTYEWMYNVIGG